MSLAKRAAGVLKITIDAKIRLAIQLMQKFQSDSILNRFDLNRFEWIDLNGSQIEK